MYSRPGADNEECTWRRGRVEGRAETRGRRQLRAQEGRREAALSRAAA